MLRMSEICESPFDYDNYWDVHVKEEIDIQLFIGSLSLYPKYSTPPPLPNLHPVKPVKPVKPPKPVKPVKVASPFQIQDSGWTEPNELIDCLSNFWNKLAFTVLVTICDLWQGFLWKNLISCQKIDLK